MIALYGHGMAHAVIDEFELGERAARAIDSEACGFGPLVDYQCLLDEGCGVVHEPGTSPHCSICAEIKWWLA